MFGDIEIERYKFHYCKYPINIDNVDVDKIRISKSFLFVERVLNTFFGYNAKLSHCV